MIVRSFQSGFSLIELLVSLTIFSVVVTMTTGTLLVLIDSNAKAQNIQSVVNNITFALDSITREIRTGTSYVCDSITSAPSGVDDIDDVQDCENGGNYISVVESGNSLTSSFTSPRISFYYDANYYSPGHGAIIRKLGNDTSGSNDGWYPITSENVRIADMRFTVTGTDNSASDDIQPTVTIFVEGKAGDLDAVDSSFSMQTTVTQRLIDL